MTLHEPFPRKLLTRRSRHLAKEASMSRPIGFAPPTSTLWPAWDDVEEDEFGTWRPAAPGVPVESVLPEVSKAVAEAIFISRIVRSFPLDTHPMRFISTFTVEPIRDGWLGRAIVLGVGLANRSCWRTGCCSAPHSEWVGNPVNFTRLI